MKVSSTFKLPSHSQLINLPPKFFKDFLAYIYYCDEYGVWVFIPDLNRTLFYPKPQQDTFLFGLVESSSSMYKTHDISNLISPVLTVNEGTLKRRKTITRKCSLIYGKCLFSSLTSFGENEEQQDCGILVASANCECRYPNTCLVFIIPDLVIHHHQCIVHSKLLVSSTFINVCI